VYVVGALAGVGVLLVLGLLQEAISLVSYNLETAVLDPLADITDDSSFIAGSGTGLNTVAARYGAPELTDAYYDSWYLKALVELGVLGLLLTWGLFAALLAKAWQVFRSITDTALLPVAAAFLAFAAWVVANNVKGFYLDLDPINVYFWLFLGITMKLAVLGRE